MGLRLHPLPSPLTVLPELCGPLGALGEKKKKIQRWPRRKGLTVVFKYSYHCFKGVNMQLWGWS